MDQAQQVLRRLEKEAAIQFAPMVGPVKGKVLENLIRKHKPKRILEIGTLFGYSAILMARLGPEVITIEIEKSNILIAAKNIQEAGLSNIRIIYGDAVKVIPTLEGKFDMIFIDAAKNQYLKYLKLSEGYLKKGGIVVADNAGIFKDAMLDFLDYVKNSDNYQSRTLKVGGDAMEISIKA